MSLITITQKIGCEGLTVARLVAEGLHVELFDDQRLQQLGVELGIAYAELRDMDRGAPGLFDRVFSKRPEIYRNFMESIVYEAAKKGEGVIIGHGSQMLLPEFGCAFHVMIHAAESTRINNLIYENSISSETARKLIRGSDQQQAGYFQYTFHQEIENPALYDLIINTEHITPEIAAGYIIQAQGSDRIKSCDFQARRVMEKLSLNREIEGALLSNHIKIKWLEIEVTEKGKVRISGFIYSQEEKKKALEIIRSLPGVLDIQEDIMVLSHF